MAHYYEEHRHNNIIKQSIVKGIDLCIDRISNDGVHSRYVTKEHFHSEDVFDPLVRLCDVLDEPLFLPRALGAIFVSAAISEQATESCSSKIAANPDQDTAHERWQKLYVLMSRHRRID